VVAAAVSKTVAGGLPDGGRGLLLACVNVMGLQFARAERAAESRPGGAHAIGAALAHSRATGDGVGSIVAAPVARWGWRLVQTRSNALPRSSGWGRPDARLILPLDANHAVVCGGAFRWPRSWSRACCPPWRATRLNPAVAWPQLSRGITGDAQQRRMAAAAASVGGLQFQIALSLVLVSATCLFAFSLQQLRSFDSGVRRERLLVWTWTRTMAATKTPAW